ncbi:MAG: UDP-N-acetylglucosamine 2-epimerase, partial [Tissierellia bacterium]|nr:UDP-N-acetylglucosamine 2-epimerase [Tissierellia bacterium]
PMKNMFRAISRILDEHKDVKAVYPVHLNPRVREIASEFLQGDNLRLIDPLDVLTFHNIMARSYLILTDSGGIQEEAPALGIPVIVMRDTTERPEGVIAGTLKLVGTGEEAIYSTFKELLDNNDKYSKMSNANNPYGDGTACIKIADIIEETFIEAATKK